jgi:aminotransferase
VNDAISPGAEIEDPEEGFWGRGPFDEPITRRVENLLARSHPDQRLRISGSPYVELPAHIREALAASIAMNGYAPSLGDPVLREAVADSLAARGVVAGADQVLITDGAMHALDLVFRAVLQPGDEVLMPAPGFFVGGLVQRASGRLVYFPSSAERGFKPDWDAAASRVTPRTKIIYVNTPVNPTGYVYDDSDLIAACALAERAGLLLVSDESLSHFVYGGRLHKSPLAAWPGEQRAVLVGSFSKDYALPGMRVGYAVLPEIVFRSVASILEWSVLSVSRPAQAAALAALTGPRDWISRMVADAASRGMRVAEELAAMPGLTCLAPSGGLNLFPAFAGDAERLTYDLVLRSGVPVCPGSAFGMIGNFRLQFGGDEHDLGIALQRIRHTLSEPSSSVAG